MTVEVLLSSARRKAARESQYRGENVKREPGRVPRGGCSVLRSPAATRPRGGGPCSLLVTRRLALLSSLEITLDAQQKKRQRECVFQFGDPGSRGGANRMDGKNYGRQPGTRNAQAQKETPDQDGAGGRNFCRP